jgi:hypothetical protein
VGDGAARPEAGRTGEIVEELHEMTLSAPEAWAAAVRASPFAETAVFDGAQQGYPAVEPGAEGPMLWHELTRERETSYSSRPGTRPYR